MDNRYSYQWSVHEKEIQIGKTSYNNYPRHFHSNVEIQYALEGSFAVFVNSTRYELNQGDLLVIFPFQLHQKKDNYNNHREMVITVSTSVLNDYRNCLATCLPACPVIKSDKITEECHAVLKWLSKTRSADEDIDRLRKSLINTVFWYFVQNVELLDIDDCYKTIPQIVKHCEKHCFDENLSLDSISHDLGISKFYISRMFSQRLRITFSKYINNLRIDHACRLLKTTDDSITQIALDCGYNTIRHFNRIFLEQTGTTPRDFREKNK